VRVEFWKYAEKGRRGCGWDAYVGKRTHVPGAFMAYGEDVPHDVGQYVVEAATGFRGGFWDLLSRGATFKSTGRRRTRPGRAIIAKNRDTLKESEQLAARHYSARASGETTPVVEALDAAHAQWRRLQPGERLTFEWPSPVGQVVPQGSPLARVDSSWVSKGRGFT
jgi:hypothetical protein